MKRDHVFIYVQHLLGIGHLKRAASLARAIAGEGMGVTLASGGVPVPDLDLDGVEFVQLPPVSAVDVSFKVLVDENNLPITPAWRDKRMKALLAAWRAARADALVIELFPFGRRQMRFEILPLLEDALVRRPRPVVACSVRDVLQAGPNTAMRAPQVLAWLERYFDHVLVHGDPVFVPFSASFSDAERIAHMIEHTGYVTNRPSPAAKGDAVEGDVGGEAGANEVLVSAGGGAVGYRLLETAILAWPLSKQRSQVWRLLSGVNLPERDFARLQSLAASHGDVRIIVERTRSDFQTLLANCRVSISQGGYNTVIEALFAGARALVVPFSDGAESEQALRAELLARRGLVEVLHETQLSPESLAAAIDHTACRAPPAAHALNLDGGAQSARLLRGWMAQREQEG